MGFLNVRARFRPVGPVMLMDARTTRFACFALQLKHTGNIVGDHSTFFFLAFAFLGSLTLSVPKDAV